MYIISYIISYTFSFWSFLPTTLISVTQRRVRHGPGDLQARSGAGAEGRPMREQQRVRAGREALQTSWIAAGQRGEERRQEEEAFVDAARCRKSNKYQFALGWAWNFATKLCNSNWWTKKMWIMGESVIGKNPLALGCIAKVISYTAEVISYIVIMKNCININKQVNR